MNSNSLYTFNVPFQNTVLKADLLSGNQVGHVLSIHGGSKQKDVFNEFRTEIYNNYGIGSTSFDCIGHGETGGILCDSSLHSRTNQALAVYNAANNIYLGKEAKDVKITACIGVSMGAYNAIKLTQLINLEALILVVPGVYTPSAYHAKFGSGFSNIIRTHRSWEHSDAWDILSDFQGRLLVVAAENDKVIPDEIPEKLFSCATKVHWKNLIIVPNADHSGLLCEISRTPHLKNAFYQSINICLEKEANNR